jgi:tetratricopeptide (TPR) repeat protein
MHLRPKTTRRLLILGGILLGLAAIGVTVWIVSSRKTAARIAKAREGAMEAYKKGDYVAALPLFGEYLTDTRTAEKAPGKADVEALLAYGKSRLAIPLPKGQHLRQAKQIFERYLQLKPGDRDAQHLLLGLYPRIHYNEEALALADNVLASDPKDVPALRAKVAAFGDQRKYKEALAASEQLLKVVPDDLDAHATLQQLMIAMDKTGDEAPAQVVKRYEALLAQHENDPRFELLLARAYLMSGQYDLGKRYLKLAAGRPGAADPAVAAKLTPLLDKLKLFDDSTSLLERMAATADEDAIHQRPLIRRLWQSGQPKEVLKRTETQDPASPTADTDLLAYRALALYDLNRPADAAPIVEALAGRKDDMAAVAWSTALRTREGGDNLPPRDRTKRYSEALERAPDNEVIHYFLAEAYLALDESEPALRELSVASRLAPNWAAPAAEISRTLVATGRSGDAVEYARLAFQRAPKLFGTRVQYVLAVFADQQQDPRPEIRDQLFGIVEEIQQKMPGEPETLHVYASLLSRMGKRDKAVAVIKSAMKTEAPAPRDTLLKLALVSYVEKLGLESDVLDFAERTYGMSPAIALRKAVLVAQKGKSKDGLKLLEEARKSDAKTNPVIWSLAVLRYRDSIGDETALNDWVRLGDSNPDDLAVQLAVLRSESRRRDKAFWLRTIDRLKKLSAEDAVVPRLERARWLLAGDPSKAQSAEAITLLSGVANTPEVHRLLGIAQEKTAALSTGSTREGLLNNAAKELETALGARGSDESVANDLTRVYRALGRNSDADRVMAKVAERAADLGIDGRKRTARMLINAGQLTRAIDVLEPIGDGQDPGRDAMLCGLYRRIGQNDKAAKLYGKLLTNERAEAATLADGAEFFAALDKPQEAAKFIARIKSMDIPPATRDTLLAEYAEHFGNDAEALAGYEAAVKADPGQPAAWHALVGYHLRELKFPEAVAAADRGLKQLPDDRTLQSLRARASALQAYEKDPNLKTLANELAADPESAAITDMLPVLGEAKASKEPLASTVAKLRELADRNPGLLRLQRYVAEGYVKLGQYDDAETVAARTAVRLPNDREAAKMMMQIYAARPGKEKWSRVLEAARQWRQRSLDAPLDADVAIAQTLIELRRPGDAVAQLKPHVIAAAAAQPAGKPASQPTTQPNVSPGVLSLYAKALLRSGDDKSAAALLSPMAKNSPDWRRVWLKLGTAGFDDGTPAVRWVDQVVPMIPPDSAAERSLLAETWCAVGTQFSSKPALDKAKPLIDQMTGDAKTSAEGWRLLAAWAEASGDMEQATRAYRELLKVQPDNADVQNNLAYALLSTGSSKDLPEAHKLAEAAVGKSPESATYQDTLARVYLAAGELPAAEKAFEQALKAERGSIEAMIGLADVHARAGRPEKVKELLARINDALASGVTLSPGLQRQLDGVRQSVKSPVQSGRIE